MNTYVPVRKIMKIVTPQKIAKRERHISLQECLDSSNENRRRRSRWKHLVVLLIGVSFIVYIYAYKSYTPSMTVVLTASYEGIVPTITYEPVDTPVDAEDQDPSARNAHVDGISLPHNAAPINFDTADNELVKKKKDELPLCYRKKSNFSENYTLTFTSLNLTQENVYPDVKNGGYYRPTGCRPKHRVAIIVPYRNRLKNLGIFLYNIHPFLMKQKIEYQIFVIEQDRNEPFNKGRLLNAGFKEMMKFSIFHCLVVHDLDLLPLNDHILYSCPTLPRHMCAKVDTNYNNQFNSTTYKFQSLFGGVVSLSVEQYERANGFSNLYFGWGGEDNDLYWRLRAAGYPVVRYNKSVGRYFVLPHQREAVNHFRHHLLSRAVERYKIDGLSNLEYFVISTKFLPLCTHIVVDINPRYENIDELNRKWEKSFYEP